MNSLILTNYLVLSILLSLFTLEAGVALLSLLNYEKYKEKTLRYVAPIWEITGTFAVFFIVNLSATYPSLIKVVAPVYTAPVFLVAILIILRNSFLAYSELFATKREELVYSRIYGTATLITAFILVSMITSVITGNGLNSDGSANFLQLFINPLNMILFLSTIAFVSTCTIIFFNLNLHKDLVFSIAATIFLSAVGTAIYAPSLMSNFLQNTYFMILPSALFALTMAGYILKSKLTRFIVLPFILSLLFSIELLTSPYLLNGTLNLNNYLVQAPGATYVQIITIMGGIFLVIALGVFVYLQHKDPSKNKRKE